MDDEQLQNMNGVIIELIGEINEQLFHTQKLDLHVILLIQIE
jgi:hypothetical protein